MTNFQGAYALAAMRLANAQIYAIADPLVTPEERKQIDAATKLLNELAARHRQARTEAHND